MELQYDSIFQVLNRIQHDPKIVIKSKSPYQNVIQLFIADDTEIEHADVFFPANKLMVNRLPDDFIKNHRALFKTYWEKAGKPLPNFAEIWATTAHLKRSNTYLIELSFE